MDSLVLPQVTGLDRWIPEGQLFEFLETINNTPDLDIDTALDQLITDL